jgi:hypothetical protein
LKTGWKCAVNRTGKGYFVKGRSGNPGGRPKNPPEFAPSTGGSAGADRRTVGNLVMEARKFSGLAINTLVELMKGTHTDSTRFNAATALVDRGFGLASSERGFAPARRGKYETVV